MNGNIPGLNMGRCGGETQVRDGLPFPAAITSPCTDPELLKADW